MLEKYETETIENLHKCFRKSRMLQQFSIFLLKCFRNVENEEECYT